MTYVSIWQVDWSLHKAMTPVTHDTIWRCSRDIWWQMSCETQPSPWCVPRSWRDSTLSGCRCARSQCGSSTPCLGTVSFQIVLTLWTIIKLFKNYFYFIFMRALVSSSNISYSKIKLPVIVFFHENNIYPWFPVCNTHSDICSILMVCIIHTIQRFALKYFHTFNSFPYTKAVRPYTKALY